MPNNEIKGRLKAPKNWRMRHRAGVVRGDQAAGARWVVDEQERDRSLETMTTEFIAEEHILDVEPGKKTDPNGAGIKIHEWQKRYTGTPLLSSADLPDYSMGTVL